MPDDKDEPAEPEAASGETAPSASNKFSEELRERGLRNLEEAARNQPEWARKMEAHLHREEASAPKQDSEPQRVSLAEATELFKGQKIKLVLLPRADQEAGVAPPAEKRSAVQSTTAMHSKKELDVIYEPVRRLAKVYVESPREKRKEMLHAELAKMEPKSEQE